MLVSALVSLSTLTLAAAAPVDAPASTPVTTPVASPASTPSSPPPAPAPTYPATFKGTVLHPNDKIGNILRNKCLDVKGGVFANGTPVQMCVPYLGMGGIGGTACRERAISLGYDW